jgi:hypothetical protein
MAKELTQTIEENANGPAEVSGDSGAMKQHPLKDQIEADRYLKSRQAAQSSGLGVRVSKLVPPGA